MIFSNIFYTTNITSGHCEPAPDAAPSSLVHYNTNFSAKKRAKSRFCLSIYEPHTNCVHFKQARVLARITSKIRNSFNITDSQNRPTEMRKWRNWRSFGARMRSELDFITSCAVVGSAIWKVVSGAQVKTTQTSTELLRFWRKRLTLGVWTDKRFRPWDPNNLRMDLAVDTAALKAERL